ncbi:MAG: DUF2330 domain-containing protein [Chloroflexi bacterium]|nr:DUF2330 domain-containing protein [Chloroflexota bacterium]
MKRFLVIFFTLVIIMGFGVSAYADGGHYSFNPNISIYQEGQKAICAWNGREEIMILSKDLKAGGKTKVLEFVPLPSKPTKVEKADAASFEAVNRLIYGNMPYDIGRSEAKSGASTDINAVEVVFHEKIGAHDITIVRANDYSEFMNWIYKFLQKEAVEYNPRWGGKAIPLISDLMNEGIHYFVFDIIELTPEVKTIEPIKYRFPTKSLYFPLRVSSLDEGRVSIGLFLLTPKPADIHGTLTGFDCGHYVLPAGPVAVHRAQPVPIKFQVKKEQLNDIDMDISNLFGNGNAWLSTAVFRGPVNMLKKDFYIR